MLFDSNKFGKRTRRQTQQKQQQRKMGLYDDDNDDDTPLPPQPPPSNDTTARKKSSGIISDSYNTAKQAAKDTDWDAQLQQLQQRADNAARVEKATMQQRKDQEWKQREDARALFGKGKGKKKGGDDDDDDEWLPNRAKGPIDDEPWFTG
eukprot:CAMPEP_0185739496 /NCGR_PEP_ID=MMETSP1171-20130828/35562_1 /TAXON_ID=374046 /ORGANISM="Helicotheca tamensis, Strain CCMP826" /LENGTH=149 /DNA_ID=CAMNT_0028411081 /DNA_START=89 /DNA_END=538 /DNA_ORIENTATION=-